MGVQAVAQVPQRLNSLMSFEIKFCFTPQTFQGSSAPFEFGKKKDFSHYVKYIVQLHMTSHNCTFCQNLDFLSYETTRTPLFEHDFAFVDLN